MPSAPRVGRFPTRALPALPGASPKVGALASALGAYASRQFPGCCLDKPTWRYLTSTRRFGCICRFPLGFLCCLVRAPQPVRDRVSGSSIAAPRRERFGAVRTHMLRSCARRTLVVLFVVAPRCACRYVARLRSNDPGPETTGMNREAGTKRNACELRDEPRCGSNPPNARGTRQSVASVRDGDVMAIEFKKGRTVSAKARTNVA